MIGYGCSTSVSCCQKLIYYMKKSRLLYRIGCGAVALGQRDVKRAGDQHGDAEEGQGIGEIAEEIPADDGGDHHLSISQWGEQRGLRTSAIGRALECAR